MARFRLSSALFLGILVSASPSALALSPADDSAGDSVQRELDAMRKQLDEMQQRNRELESKVDELGVQVKQDWTTEARAEEMRQVVYDVLADADTRASLLDDGVAAGWSDGFFLASADGRFRLNIGGQEQIRWVYSFIDEPDRHRQGFENTRTKLVFSGHAFSRDLQYLVRLNMTRNEPGLVDGLAFLEDAWVRFNLTDTISIRAGQFRVPFNREELVSSAYQLAVERSNVNESLNLGRTQGIELVWADEVHRVAIALDDGASDNLGGFTSAGGGIATTPQQVGDPINNDALFQDVEWAVQGRYEYIIAGTRNQFEDFTSPIGDPFGAMFGIAASVQRSESDGALSATRNEIDWFAWTADLSLEFGGANLFISYIQHYVDRGGSAGQFNFYGVVVQGGYYITPKWEVFARGEWGKADSKQNLIGPTNDLMIATFGANYYFDGHGAKWTTDIGFALNEISGDWDFDITGYRQQNTDSKPQIVFRTQFQLLF